MLLNTRKDGRAVERAPLETVFLVQTGTRVRIPLLPPGGEHIMPRSGIVGCPSDKVRTTGSAKPRKYAKHTEHIPLLPPEVSV